jgi:hypothetical protein
MNGDAAQQPVFLCQLMLELLADVFQHPERLAGHFYPDAIAGQDQYVKVHV